MTRTTIDTVLIANRGEIACRVINTVHSMGLKAVAIYSDADRSAPHVHLADKAVHVGPAAAAHSYLDIDKVIEAARASGADAIHPGYGFLSENAAFARRCEEEGIVFIGPPAEAIDTMGDKITARATVESRGVPTVPGISRPGLSDQEIIDAAPDIGFPVLIKPSAGGGGKGMHRVENIEDLPQALVTARREAASSFGDSTLFLEHFVDTPRHIEVQIVADSHGNVIHLGERECSLQRRHQKVIEEAPSALLDAATREDIGQAACDAARACGYRGAGTVEFIVSASQPDRFFFMEMNTRLQVEHPVTELVTGVDLVEWQIRVARGEQLPLRQDQVELTGHAVEARVYAEDAAAGFLPTGGTISALSWPVGPGVRVDSGVAEGQTIGSDYDPMLAKVITWGSDRTRALKGLDDALAATVIDGVVTNVNFNRFLITHPDVLAGDLHTGLVDELCGDFANPSTPLATLGLVALHHARNAGRQASRTLSGAWTLADAWRGGRDAAPIRLLLTDNPDDAHSARTISLTEKDNGAGSPRTWTLTSETLVDDSEAAVVEQCELQLLERPAGNRSSASDAAGQAATPYHLAIDGGPAEHWIVGATSTCGRYYVTGPQGTVCVTHLTGTAADSSAQDSTGALTSPMPGTVIAVEVESGASVNEGQTVLVIEAMKMEHTIAAQVAGEVSIAVAVGDKVTTGQVLAEVHADGEDA
ncbi:acetyl/propionyl-CoA carboxylase subunit alpha [Corynebacterium sp. 320]|uniref:ATP-binding protein n=1 Tax=Corynebacterium TaxID=1716 RepID=UPI00125CC156|nr:MULTISPECIES: biotin carboxylase N-terminal domain-containing protein [Corynebacterium]KAB1504125.1 acetyl/propionyl-CoA carboxylase subunit alpha [Corynebacterium sp. 320]KAB3528261.1 acetyl/propionyl-CoA carboxylase subunit alpha [Corynebacterium sp. 250]QNP91801.1 acetyl/propionyl-CoA carboxylase subunit alpha [Corynebacterium zhongnanshanii]